MDALTYLREEIKTYFPDSKELQLSGSLANQPRFNFYFEITCGLRFLLYLNWDGDGDGFTLKCLEFVEPGVLKKLISSYPDAGSKVFNIGQPRSTIGFLYKGENKLQPLFTSGYLNEPLGISDITVGELLNSIDPTFIVRG
ncbi:hypothetical protein [Dyadobacter crusticola]|uniref:hypothetical protein n=1 Tax=Dyadobacter crusticola TaxID=292407 RepID=UPI0012FBC0C7|nr:hypothetical protein [Dyadobacter crusticola]